MVEHRKRKNLQMFGDKLSVKVVYRTMSNKSSSNRECTTRENRLNMHKHMTLWSVKIEHPKKFLHNFDALIVRFFIFLCCDVMSVCMFVCYLVSSPRGIKTVALIPVLVTSTVSSAPRFCGMWSFRHEWLLVSKGAKKYVNAKPLATC